MRGLFNAHECVSGDTNRRPFQSALRMRGLFNSRFEASASVQVDVSIRLADAWPFQPARSAATTA